LKNASLGYPTRSMPTSDFSTVHGSPFARPLARINAPANEEQRPYCRFFLCSVDQDGTRVSRLLSRSAWHVPCLAASQSRLKSVLRILYSALRAFTPPSDRVESCPPPRTAGTGWRDGRWFGKGKRPAGWKPKRDAG
jgi:hypothetical protein